MAKGKNLKVNFIVACFSQLVSVIFAFVVPKMMIGYYGPQIHGLVSTINSLISYLMLVEAGLSAASIQGLYKPIKDNDYKEINAGLNAISRFYTRVGIVFSILVIGLAVIYPLFASDGLSYHLIFILILISGIAQTIEFFMCCKYKILLQADKKIYVINFVNALGVILQGTLRILFMLMKFNIYIVQFVPAIVYIFRLFIIVNYIRKHYPYLNSSIEPNFSVSKKRWNVLIHQISNLVVNNTDSIVLSKAVGYNSVSIYSIYQMVVSNINGFLTQSLSNAITANFGHLFVDDNYEERLQAYEQYERVYYYIISIIFSGLSISLYPFVDLYIGNVNGIQYADYRLVVLFVVNALLCNIRIPQLTIVTASGHFKETQWHAITEAVCNIVVSIALVNKLGIYGVLIGTTCSYLVRDVMFILYVNKKILYRRVKYSIINIIRMLAIYATNTFCGLLLVKIIVVDNWTKWAIITLSVVVIGIIITGIYLLIFDRKTLKLILNIVGIEKAVKELKQKL